jgi:hypothetical protein
MVLSVTVFQFEYFDRAANKIRVSPDFATEKAIVSIGATPLPHTAKEVPEAEITFSGIWRPRVV